MGFFRFIWRNALRNKRRTSLTVLSIGFSLFLLTALITFMDILFNPPFQDESALRVMVTRNTSIADIMPIAYRDKIRRVPNVEYVSALQWFNGIYKDPDFLFANFAVDADHIFDIYSEQKISPAERAAFIATRTSAVASEMLAKRFGWKPGDTITLQGTIFPVDLELKIVGIFTDPIGQETLFFRFDYMDEALGGLGQIGAFTVKVKDAASVPVVGQAIDALFRNSPAETKTETEKAFVLGFISMLGNVQTIIGSVAGVVVFTMLLVAVSTMAMTVRERLREVAILKTIGYTQRIILALVVGEALLISSMGTCLGLLLAESLKFADMNRITQGFIPIFIVTPGTYAAVVGTGLVIGLLAGFLPARQAVNLTITAAMRRLD